jgi:hypothetical protein
MKVSCPTCRAVLPASQVNVATDVAVCANCGEAFSLARIIAAGHGTHDFDIHQPPRGAWFEDTDTGWRIAASTRSPLAFFVVPFMCVWSGGSIGGIYGSQIAEGQFNLLLSLFGIPFVLGSVALASLAVMSVCGKVVVSTDCNDGQVFTGVGPFGWTRRFAWASINAVEEDSLGHASGSNGRVISLVGQSRIKFGSLLTEPRRFYLLQGLRKLLASRVL